MSQPNPPLYLPPPRCFTCGNVTAHLQIDYWVQLQNMVDGSSSDLPIRSIGEQKLVERSVKTAEGKVLDKLGVIRYCCRRMILTTSRSKVPLPVLDKDPIKKKDQKVVLP